MIEVYKYEGNNEEECRLKYLDELDVYNNEVITKEYSNDDKIIVEVVKKDDIKQYIDNYIKTLSKNLNLKINCNIFEEDNIFYVRMKSTNNAILIGKDGKTLSSIQFLIRKSVSNMIGFNLSINMDVSNYKQKIEKKFESEIKRLINDVLKTKIEVKLDPMNSYKRRIVHSIANNYYNIETLSVGEEPNRYTIIKYVENK